MGIATIIEKKVEILLRLFGHEKKRHVVDYIVRRVDQMEN